MKYSTLGGHLYLVQWLSAGNVIMVVFPILLGGGGAELVDSQFWTPPPLVNTPESAPGLSRYDPRRHMFPTNEKKNKNLNKK